MSSDLTHEEVVGAPKMHSSSAIAAINASAATPVSPPRVMVRLQELRGAIDDAHQRGTLGGDAFARVVDMVDELERKHPGVDLVPLDATEALTFEALDAEYRAHRRAQDAERFRATWPKCASGPCVAGPFGLVLPAAVKTRAEADAILAQLFSTRVLRELTSREKEAVRVLRRQGIAQPSAPEEFAAIAAAKLRRLSKAAKRARHAQRMMEGNRAAAQRLAGEAAC